MKILATDLDRTLLPNGSWKADENAIPLFNELTEKHNIFVVYVTGRNLNLTEQAIREYGIRYPHILCGDVGTTIRKYNNGSWEMDEGWIDHVKAESPRWNIKEIKAILASVSGIKEQEKEHLNQFKLSYYADHHKKDDILAEINDSIKGKVDEVIIYSYDSQYDKGLIDILPLSATKQTCLEYIAKKHEVNKSELVFCGDSGNDILPLTAGFSGVLVRNADDQLIEHVKNAMTENSNLKAYFAKGCFNELNGYYTSGVIEGAYHYGLFD